MYIYIYIHKYIYIYIYMCSLMTTTTRCDMEVGIGGGRRLPHALPHKLTHARRHAVCAIVSGQHTGTTKGLQRDHSGTTELLMCHWCYFICWSGQQRDNKLQGTQDAGGEGGFVVESSWPRNLDSRGHNGTTTRPQRAHNGTTTGPQRDHNGTTELLICHWCFEFVDRGHSGTKLARDAGRCRRRMVFRRVALATTFELAIGLALGLTLGRTSQAHNGFTLGPTLGLTHVLAL